MEFSSDCPEPNRAEGGIWSICDILLRSSARILLSPDSYLRMLIVDIPVCLASISWDILFSFLYCLIISPVFMQITSFLSFIIGTSPRCWSVGFTPHFTWYSTCSYTYIIPNGTKNAIKNKNVAPNGLHYSKIRVIVALQVNQKQIWLLVSAS